MTPSESPTESTDNARDLRLYQVLYISDAHCQRVYLSVRQTFLFIMSPLTGTLHHTESKVLLTVLHEQRPVTIHVELQLFENAATPKSAFLVIYPDKQYGKALCSLHVRHTRVEELGGLKLKVGFKRTVCIMVLAAVSIACFLHVCKNFGRMIASCRHKQRKCTKCTHSFMHHSFPVVL